MFCTHLTKIPKLQSKIGFTGPGPDWGDVMGRPGVRAAQEARGLPAGFVLCRLDSVHHGPSPRAPGLPQDGQEQGRGRRVFEEEERRCEEQLQLQFRYFFLLRSKSLVWLAD
jgi:hypothetical protein